jgi:hypothetical protein
MKRLFRIALPTAAMTLPSEERAQAATRSRTRLDSLPPGFERLRTRGAIRTPVERDIHVEA